MNLDDKISRIKIALERDNATFVDIEDKPLRSTQVTFACNCGKEHKKGFLTLEKYASSAICKECTNKNMMNKISKTNKEKYGFEHNVLNDKFRQKGIDAKQTNEYKEKRSVISKKMHENFCDEKKKDMQEKRKNTTFKKTGFTNAMQDPKNKEKRNKTNLEKYGVEHAITNPIVKEKALKTMEKNTGKQYALQTEESKAKQKETMIKKYGVDHSEKIQEFVDKKKNTNLQKYGVENYMKHPEFKEKTKATCLEKYGVENAMQNPEIAEKSFHNSYRTKEYKTPKGNIIKYQGYENHALDELLIYQNISEEEIINGASKVPIITYPGTNNNYRRHYIDIYLPTQNKCIEVKSPYTFSLDKENILRKRAAGKAMGYIYEIWVI
jgi:hypothetical protein